jgi:hypothetical protein
METSAESKLEDLPPEVKSSMELLEAEFCQLDAAKGGPPRKTDFMSLLQHLQGDHLTKI